jgi:hypothetical protein
MKVLRSHGLAVTPELVEAVKARVTRGLSERRRVADAPPRQHADGGLSARRPARAGGPRSSAARDWW